MIARPSSSIAGLQQRGGKKESTGRDVSQLCTRAGPRRVAAAVAEKPAGLHDPAADSHSEATRAVADPPSPLASIAACENRQRQEVIWYTILLFILLWLNLLSSTARQVLQR